MIWTDILIIVIIVGFGITGYFKGFFESIFRILSVVLSIMFAIILYPLLSKLLDPIMHESIRDAIFEKLIDRFPELSKETITSEVVNRLSLPDFLKEAVSSAMPDPKKLIDSNEIVGMMAEKLTEISIAIISVIVLFIIIRIGMSFLKFILKKIADKVVPKKVDKVGGFAFGTIEGIFIVFLLLTVITLFNSIGIFTNFYQYADESTTITKFFYDNNLIVDWIVN